jgi:hypothetical protein
MGSCFADSIGSRLVANKVDTLVNPFGTVFQPLALTRLLRAAAGEEVDWQQHLVEARGRWQSYDLHGSIGADSPVDLLQTIQELVRQTGEFLRSTDVVLLTLGTAWAYRLRETGELVNNCHKQSADLFVRELLTPDEIINELAETHAYLRRINPDLRFVLTVSPVRHLKDTLPLNAVSKSVLRLVTHIVSDLLPGVAYFPAYELLLDDLRDYRFYAADMLHPSDVAEDYIWDKFARTYFDVDFGRFRKEWKAVRQSLGHRPLHPGAPEHRQFLNSTLEKLEQLSLRKVEVAAELKEVRTRIAALPELRQPEPEGLPEDDEERIDIGQDQTATTAEATALPTVELPPLAEDRPARLSPEEFRSQRATRSSQPGRGRRDGRGKGQPAVSGENEPFRAASLADDQSEDASLVATTELPAAARPFIEQSSESAISADAPDLSLEAANGGEPAKKKKRRSRGGAKRTARKNALRMATGDLVAPDANLTQAAPSTLRVTDEEVALGVGDTTEEQAEEVSPPTITAPAPTKQGGRRNKAGRMPRVELYAPASDVPADEKTPPTIEAELPVSEPTVSAIGSPTITGDSPTTEPGFVAPKRNRNRGRRDAVPANAVENSAAISSFDVLEPPATPATGNVEQLLGAGAPELVGGAIPSRSKPRKQPAISAVPAPVATELTPAVSELATPEMVPPPAARRSNRAKRVVSGGRAEKLAVDTPIIPIPDPASLRTQVAAGRMTGTSASLIEPSAKSATKPKKAAAPKQPAKPAAAKKAAKEKPVKPAPESKPTAPKVKPSAGEVPAPAAKREPAAKPKAADKPAAAKPKPPRKPAKPT